MVWAGWAVMCQEVPRVVGLWLGNFIISALGDETGRVLLSVRHGVHHHTLETNITEFKMAAFLGPEPEFHIQLNPKVTHT